MPKACQPNGSGPQGEGLPGGGIEGACAGGWAENGEGGVMLSSTWAFLIHALILLVAISNPYLMWRVNVMWHPSGTHSLWTYIYHAVALYLLPAACARSRQFLLLIAVLVLYGGLTIKLVDGLSAGVKPNAGYGLSIAYHHLMLLSLVTGGIYWFWHVAMRLVKVGSR
jgi:hypothetical protein